MGKFEIHSDFQTFQKNVEIEIAGKNLQSEACGDFSVKVVMFEYVQTSPGQTCCFVSIQSQQSEMKRIFHQTENIQVILGDRSDLCHQYPIIWAIGYKSLT